MIEISKGLKKTASLEYLELIEFFIETGTQIACDDDNGADRIITALFVHLFCPELSERVEAKFWK